MPSSMATTKQGPHALVFAYPLQGHIIPSVHLAINLASRGFTITFINEHSINRRNIKANKNNNSSSSSHIEGMFTSAREAGLDIRYETVSDGLPVELDRSLNDDDFNLALVHLMSAHVEELVAKLVKRAEPPVICLIADSFFVWPSKIAEKFDLLYASFWTEPALVFSLYYHIDLLRENGHFDCHDCKKDAIDYIPGVESIDPKDLISYLQQADTSTTNHQLIFAAFNDVKNADFVLCNTVQELEPRVIAALQAYMPFYAMGPLFPSGFMNGRASSLNVSQNHSRISYVGTSLWSESDCSQWLNSKPHGSVLYASFGSYAHITKRDLAEIANGLLLSNVNFIWVLRPDVVSSLDVDPLPVGFNEAICDRGIVLPWCNQTKVLTHPAIRGFLTHCGWNSILEAIWCEIPLLCYPLLTDQFTNRKLVVDDWKIGINLSDRTVVTKEEVSENVSRIIDGKLWGQLKDTMRDVKKKLEDALNSNGSSEKNIECFIQDLTAKAKIQFDPTSSYN